MQPHPAVFDYALKARPYGRVGCPKAADGVGYSARGKRAAPASYHLASPSTELQLDDKKHEGGLGYDTKAMRTIVRLRKKDPHQRDEEEAILDTYRAALGMLPGDRR